MARLSSSRFSLDFLKESTTSFSNASMHENHPKIKRVDILPGLRGETIIRIAQCDPLVERKRTLPGRPRGHDEPCNSACMKGQVLPSRCRSASLSPRPATGSQRYEAGSNGGPWKPQAASPVSQASMNSASTGVGEPPCAATGVRG